MSYDHPMLTLRNPTEATGWRRARHMVGSPDVAFAKRQARRRARHAAREALRGGAPRSKKRPGSSWDLA